MSCPIFGQEAVGFCAAFPTALQQSLRQLALTPPFTQGRLWCDGTPQVQWKITAFCQGKRIATSLLWQLLAMTRGRTASELHWFGEILGMPRKHPSVAYGDSSPYRGAIQSSRRDTTTAPSERFHSVPQSKCPWGTLAEFHFATGKISPPKGISLRAAYRPLTHSK